MSKAQYHTQVLWVARFDYPPAWQLEAHHHHFWQMIYCLDGEATCSIDGHTETISTSTLMLLPPKSVHGLEVHDDKLKTLDIKFGVNNKSLSQDLNQLSCLQHDAPTFIQQQMQRILSEAQFNAYASQDYCHALLQLLIIDLIRHHSQEETNEAMPSTLAPSQTHRHPLIESLYGYIADHFDQAISKEMFEEALNYSYRQITNICKSEINQTPFEALAQYRIHQAQKLLLYSDYAQKQIAELVGYKTVQHYSRAFKSITGNSPGQWQEAHRYAKDVGFSVDPTFKNILRLKENG